MKYIELLDDLRNNFNLTEHKIVRHKNTKPLNFNNASFLLQCSLFVKIQRLLYIKPVTPLTFLSLGMTTMNKKADRKKHVILFSYNVTLKHIVLYEKA